MKTSIGLLVIPMGCAMMALSGGCKDDRAEPQTAVPADSKQTPVEDVTSPPESTPQEEAGENDKSPHAPGAVKPPADAVHAGLVPRAGGPPADAVHGNPAVVGDKLSLAGTTMTIPEGWKSQPVRKSMMGPVAVFHLPKAEGDPADAVARVTHFPAMKGMDDRNIDRWLSQVKHPDGRDMTRDDAKISTTRQGMVKLTVVDVSGVVNPRSDGTGAGAPDHRLIAAIVDHPKGPHFIKISGGLATMKHWEESINAFLKSAEAD